MAVTYTGIIQLEIQNPPTRLQEKERNEERKLFSAKVKQQTQQQANATSQQANKSLYLASKGKQASDPSAVIPPTITTIIQLMMQRLQTAFSDRGKIASIGNFELQSGGLASFFTC